MRHVRKTKKKSLNPLVIKKVGHEGFCHTSLIFSMRSSTHEDFAFDGLLIGPPPPVSGWLSLRWPTCSWCKSAEQTYIHKRFVSCTPNEIFNFGMMKVTMWLGSKSFWSPDILLACLLACLLV